MRVETAEDYGLAIAHLRQQQTDLADWLLQSGVPPVSILSMFHELADAVLTERTRRYRDEQRRNGLGP